jgi:hypothetical protein
VLEGKPYSIEKRKLIAFLKLSNMTVGDAICNLLMIEAIYLDYDWNIEDLAGLYQENPARMYKAIVKDRTKFKTIWDESRLTEP